MNFLKTRHTFELLELDAAQALAAHLDLTLPTPHQERYTLAEIYNKPVTDHPATQKRTIGFTP